MEYADVLDSLLSPWLMSHTRQEIFSRCREKHVPFTPVRNMDEVVNCGHLNNRRYFETIQYVETDPFKCPGPPVRFSESAWDLNQTAPSLSEHNNQVYRDHLGYSKDRMAQLEGMGVI